MKVVIEIDNSTRKGSITIFDGEDLLENHNIAGFSFASKQNLGVVYGDDVPVRLKDVGPKVLELTMISDEE